MEILQAFFAGVAVGFGAAVALVGWGYHQWKRGRLTRLKFLPPPPAQTP